MEKGKTGRISMLPIVIIIIIGVIIVGIIQNNETVIRKELQGVRLNKETLSFVDNVSLTIDVKVMDEENGLTMSGKMQFSNLDYTTNNNGTLIYRKGYGEQKKESWGVINYIRNIQVGNKVVPDLVTLSDVETDDALSYMIVGRYDTDKIHGDSSNTDHQGDDILVFPASDVETALNIIEENQVNVSQHTIP